MMLASSPRRLLRFAPAMGAGAALMAGTVKAERGITKDTIRIGMHAPLTGAVSMRGYPINDRAGNPAKTRVSELRG